MKGEQKGVSSARDYNFRKESLLADYESRRCVMRLLIVCLPQ